MGFSVFIDSFNNDVSPWVKADSLDEVTLRAEGESIWDYTADAVSFEIHESVLNALNLETVSQLYKSKGWIKYDGDLIVNGWILEPKHNPKSEFITIEIASYLYVASKLPIRYSMAEILDNNDPEVGILSNENEDGDTVEAISSSVIDRIRGAMAMYGFNNNYLGLELDNIPDFIAFQSIQVEILGHSIIHTTVLINGYNMTNDFPLWGLFRHPTTDQAVLIYTIGAGWYGFVNLPEADMDNDWSFDHHEGNCTPGVTFLETELGLQYNMVGEIDDDAILNSIIDYYGEEPEFSGGARINDDLYYAVIDGSVVRIVIQDDDKYRFSYDGDTQVGQILKDIGFMADSLVAITPGNILKIVHRQTDDQVTIDQALILDKEVRVVDDTGVSLSIPNGFKEYCLESVQSSIIAYYQEIISQVKDRAALKVMKHALPVTSMFKSVDQAIIKEMRFQEETIEIITERRI